MKKNKINFWMFTMIFFLLSSLVLFGQRKTTLIPKEEYNAREEPRAQVTVVDHLVELTVGSDTWEGDTVPKYVNPIRITIDSGREDPIVVRYNNFVITNRDGKKYSVMPLYEMDAKLKKLVFDKDYEIIPKPFYDYKNYSIFPIYEPAYKTIEITDYDYIIDPYIQEKYMDWAAMDADLPTQEMRMKALPEGILDIDGIVSGFLFFEKVNPNDKEVTLKFDIVDAKSNKKISTIEIPFFVQ